MGKLIRMIALIVYLGAASIPWLFIGYADSSYIGLYKILSVCMLSPYWLSAIISFFTLDIAPLKYVIDETQNWLLYGFNSGTLTESSNEDTHALRRLQILKNSYKK